MTRDTPTRAAAHPLRRTPPGAGGTVQMLASEAGLPYRLLREAGTGPTGAFSSTPEPVWSTRFVVRVHRDADEKADAASFAVLATPRLTTAAVVSRRTAVLRGTVSPARAGTPVLVTGVVRGGRSVVLGRAVTDRAGRWVLRRSFSGPTTVQVSSRVAADRFHVAGRSPVARVAVR